MIFWTQALENTGCYRRYEKDVIVGNTGFVSLPSHLNAGKLLPALLTFTPLEISQTTIFLQAAKKGEGIWKQWWKLAVKKHALSRDLFWVRWQNICLRASRAVSVCGQSSLRCWQVADSPPAGLKALPSPWGRQAPPLQPAAFSFMGNE